MTICDINESTKVHNARRVYKVVTESDVANVEIISWNCIIICTLISRPFLS